MPAYYSGETIEKGDWLTTDAGHDRNQVPGLLVRSGA